MTDTSFTPGAGNGEVQLPAGWQSAGEAEREAYREVLNQRHGKDQVDAVIARAGVPPPLVSSPAAREGLGQDRAGEMADTLIEHASARIRAKHVTTTTVRGPDGRDVTVAIPLSPAQLAAADAEVAAYRKTVEETLARDYSLVPAAPDPNADNPELQQFDELFPVPESAAEYELSYGRRLAPEGDMQSYIALDRDLKTALHAMRVPAQIGQGMVDAWLESMDAFAEVSAANREGGVDSAHWLSQRAIVQNAFPDKSWDDISKDVQRAWNLIPRPTRELLISQGCIECAPAVIRLVQHGVRLAHRELLAKAK